jgi:uncharacterized protein YdeI (YjbR/CyaY-like superfamily)
MQVGFKRMNFVQRPTAWQQITAGKQRRLAAEQRIQEQMQPIVDGIANAQQSQATGLATIALQIANVRIHEEAAAKFAQLRKLSQS